MVTGDSIERVDCFNFLGTIISSDLGWENNTDVAVKKSQQRLFFLRQLGAGRTAPPTKEVLAEEGDSCSVLLFCY